MDERTTIANLKEKVRKFCEERDWDRYHGAKDLAIGIVTEASELLDHFRFKSEEQIKEFFASGKKKEISKELADTFYFILRFAQMCDIDLSEALEHKMKENAARYPVNKAKGSNKKYTEF